jgi:hypothetical protein
MKKITLIIFFITSFYGFGQCPAGSLGQFPTTTVNAASDNSVVGINGCNFTGEFCVIGNIVPGNEYEVLINLNSDDSAAYATIENAADNSVIAHGTSPVSFTAPAGVTSININWSSDASCVELASCHTTSIQCTSCAATPPAENDEFSGAIPITPSSAGTGCGTFNFSYPAMGTSDSGIDNTCGGDNTGLDRFYTWTATTDRLCRNICSRRYCAFGLEHRTRTSDSGF